MNTQTRRAAQPLTRTFWIARVLPFVILGVPLPSIAATSVYIAETAAGAADGSSCADARAASWFNSTANWGTGTTQIGAGTTVFLCGAVSTSLTFQGSGTSGSYVTVDGTGATMSGGFTVANRSWWKVQNVRYADGRNSSLIRITGGSNGIYTGNYADNVSGDPVVWLGQYNGASLPNNITISNNFLRTTAADLGNVQLDIVKTEGSTNIVVEGNHLEMRAGGAGIEAHNDCIQTYEKGGSSGGKPANWTIRYNKIVMNSAASNDRSWTMMEALTGTNNIYRNVFLGLQGASQANGLNIHNSGAGVIFNIYNNTFVSKAGASNNVLSLQDTGTVNLRNNIIHTTNQTALITGMTVVRDHNLWFGSNIPSCSTQGEICGQDPKFASYANNEFSLLAGSPAIGAGANLGSPYTQSIAPNATWPGPALGVESGSSWSLSAFGTSTSTVATPMPPTGLVSL